MTDTTRTTDAAFAAAVVTLESAGWAYQGGHRWVPPQSDTREAVEQDATTLRMNGHHDKAARILALLAEREALRAALERMIDAGGLAVSAYNVAAEAEAHELLCAAMIAARAALAGNAAP
jgi:hypothetical protein